MRWSPIGPPAAARSGRSCIARPMGGQRGLGEPRLRPARSWRSFAHVRRRWSAPSGCHARRRRRRRGRGGGRGQQDGDAGQQLRSGVAAVLLGRAAHGSRPAGWTSTDSDGGSPSARNVGGPSRAAMWLPRRGVHSGFAAGQVLQPVQRPATMWSRGADAKSSRSSFGAGPSRDRGRRPVGRSAEPGRGRSEIRRTASSASGRSWARAGSPLPFVRISVHLVGPARRHRGEGGPATGAQRPGAGRPRPARRRTSRGRGCRRSRNGVRPAEVSALAPVRRLVDEGIGVDLGRAVRPGSPRISTLFSRRNPAGTPGD